MEHEFPCNLRTEATIQSYFFNVYVWRVHTLVLGYQAPKFLGEIFRSAAGIRFPSIISG